MKNIIIYTASALLLFLLSCSEITNENQADKETGDSTLYASIKEIPLSFAQKQHISDSIGASEKIPRLNEAITKQFGYKELNGCILVHQSGINLIKKCFGTECLTCKKKDIIDENSLFQLASLSKTFTAIAILKMAEDSLLSLEDSVQKFYPRFPYKGVTIKNMLDHRSGLPNYLYAFDDSSKTNPPPSNQTIMKWFAEAKPDRYGLPDRGFSYNNSNYAVLAAIIEKVNNKSYDIYLQEKIFTPLGMKNTYVINHIPDTMHVTVGHERRRRIRKDFFDNVVGDKGVYSSLNDLLLWYKSLKKHKLLTEESTALAFTPQSFEKKGIRNYGLGFRMILEKDTKIPKYIYHNGWWKGYNSLFWFNPKTESLIIILSNVRNKSVYKTREIINILEPEKTLIDSTTII